MLPSSPPTPERISRQYAAFVTGVKTSRGVEGLPMMPASPSALQTLLGEHQHVGQSPQVCPDAALSAVALKKLRTELLKQEEDSMSGVLVRRSCSSSTSVLAGGTSGPLRGGGSPGRLSATTTPRQPPTTPPLGRSDVGPLPQGLLLGNRTSPVLRRATGDNVRSTTMAPPPPKTDDLPSSAAILKSATGAAGKTGFSVTNTSTNTPMLSHHQLSGASHSDEPDVAGGGAFYMSDGASEFRLLLSRAGVEVKGSMGSTAPNPSGRHGRALPDIEDADDNIPANSTNPATAGNGVATSGNGGRGINKHHQRNCFNFDDGSSYGRSRSTGNPSTHSSSAAGTAVVRSTSVFSSLFAADPYANAVITKDYFCVLERYYRWLESDSTHRSSAGSSLTVSPSSLPPGAGGGSSFVNGGCAGKGHHGSKRHDGARRIGDDTELAMPIAPLPSCNGGVGGTMGGFPSSPPSVPIVSPQPPPFVFHHTNPRLVFPTGDTFTILLFLFTRSFDGAADRNFATLLDRGIREENVVNVLRQFKVRTIHDAVVEARRQLGASYEAEGKQRRKLRDEYVAIDYFRQQQAGVVKGKRGRDVVGQGFYDDEHHHEGDDAVAGGEMMGTDGVPTATHTSAPPHQGTNLAPLPGGADDDEASNDLGAIMANVTITAPAVHDGDTAGTAAAPSAGVGGGPSASRQTVRHKQHQQHCSGSGSSTVLHHAPTTGEEAVMLMTIEGSFGADSTNRRRRMLTEGDRTLTYSAGSADEYDADDDEEGGDVGGGDDALRSPTSMNGGGDFGRHGYRANAGGVATNNTSTAGCAPTNALGASSSAATASSPTPALLPFQQYWSFIFQYMMWSTRGHQMTPFARTVAIEPIVKALQCVLYARVPSLVMHLCEFLSLGSARARSSQQGANACGSTNGGGVGGGSSSSMYTAGVSASAISGRGIPNSAFTVDGRGTYYSSCYVPPSTSHRDPYSPQYGSPSPLTSTNAEGNNHPVTQSPRLLSIGLGNANGQHQQGISSSSSMLPVPVAAPTMVPSPLKHINSDQWVSMMHFAQVVEYPLLAHYSTDDSWPLLLDEFVEWSGPLRGVVGVRRVTDA